MFSQSAPPIPRKHPVYSFCRLPGRPSDQGHGEVQPAEGGGQALHRGQGEGEEDGGLQVGNTKDGGLKVAIENIADSR